MKTLFSYLHLFLFIALLSCHQKDAGTLNYNLLTYDTSKIAFFVSNPSKYSFEKNSEPLALTSDDILLTEHILNTAVDSFNKNVSPLLSKSFASKISVDSLTIAIKKYKQQMFPFKHINGDRFIRIICFCDEFADWKTEKYFWGTDRGICALLIEINLSLKTYSSFMIGGYG